MRRGLGVGVKSLGLVSLLGATALRLGVAGSTGLTPDECYYWVWSRTLQAGYLDHPPMVALWIRAGTLLAGETALGVRLLGPIAALLGSLALAAAGERLFGRGAGWRAALLLNATLMVGVGSVVMTPDSPLLLFTAVAVWALVRARPDRRWWVAFGAATGAGLASKYLAVLPALAAPVWVAGTRRWAVLRSPWVWAGVAAAAAAFWPVVAWNAGHDWVSFAKQGGRGGAWDPAAGLRFEAELLAGQVGLATPWVFWLFAAGLWRQVRAAWARVEAGLVVAAFAVPGLAVFAEHALGDRVQGNWVAVVYPALALAAGALGGRQHRGAACVGAGLCLLAYGQAVWGLAPLPRSLDPTLVRLGGWPELAQAAEARRQAEGAGFLAAEEYGLASELAWAGERVVAAGERWRWFALERPGAGDGLLLLSARRREGPDPALWSQAVAAGELVRSRGGVEAERFLVYRVRLREGAPAAVLPRR